MNPYIVEIEPSIRKNKRFRVTLSNGDKYDFGLKTGSTYIDHKDETKRRNYILRHLANKKEKELIETLTPSPSLFSMYLLWGKTTDLQQNIKQLNRLLKSQK